MAKNRQLTSAENNGTAVSDCAEEEYIVVGADFGSDMSAMKAELKAIREDIKEMGTGLHRKLAEVGKFEKKKQICSPKFADGTIDEKYIFIEITKKKYTKATRNFVYFFIFFFICKCRATKILYFFLLL